MKDLLGVVCFHTEQCSFGNHRWTNGVSQGVEAEVRKWAADQVERLLPYLTWGRED